MLTELFKNFTLLGAEWVLWLLVALSVLSIGVMIERAMYFRQRKIDADGLTRDLRKALESGDPSTVEKRYGDSPSMEARVALAGLRERTRGVAVASEAMNEEKARARGDQERLLVILGTLGNNAPFIGLFGTVLGIIRSFRDLSASTLEGTQAVMAGIAEALIATAVGLLVALPAVAVFNMFQRTIQSRLAASQALSRVLLAHAKAEK